MLLLTLTILEQFTPRGLVLYTLGPFNITKGSLESGLFKSSLLIGTIYLSKIITSGTIKLPGKIGILIADIFSYFNQLSSGSKITPKNLINDLDNKLLNLNRDDIDVKYSKRAIKTQFAPFILSLFFIALDITII